VNTEHSDVFGLVLWLNFIVGVILLVLGGYHLSIGDWAFGFMLLAIGGLNIWLGCQD
jgi:hypothetical protein